MRAVLDTNVLISAALSGRGAPAAILVEWLDGTFDLLVSPKLLSELKRVLAYPKIRSRLSEHDARDYVELITQGSTFHEDPLDPPTIRSIDPHDDFLISLAASTRSIIVTGDADLLDLAGKIPVLNPSEFLASLRNQNSYSIHKSMPSHRRDEGLGRSI